MLGVLGVLNVLNVLENVVNVVNVPMDACLALFSFSLVVIYFLSEAFCVQY